MRKTITSLFMVPTLKIGKENLIGNNFVNAYIKDSQRDIQYDDAVYLVFKPTNSRKFRDFLDEEYERTKSIIEDYDYPNGIVVVVYKLDLNFKSDFELIKKGKYSKTSSEFQKLFQKTIHLHNKDEISLQYRIFNKAQDLRKYWEERLDITLDPRDEVWSGFFEENEILNYQNINEPAK